MLRANYGRCLIPTGIEKDKDGKVWAIWTFNPFSQRSGLWNILELKSLNDLEEVDMHVSLLLSGLTQDEE